MAERVDKAEIIVIDERVVTTYPQLGKAAYTAIVTYRRGSGMPRTLFIPLSEVAEDKMDDVFKQYNDKKGDLYKQFLTYRAKKIKEDLAGVGAFKPEIVKF